MPEDLSGFDPAKDIYLDGAGLRVLAHPLRVRMLSRLRLHGPATASQLAHALGESSGATSYHLRQLAAAGFVAEDTDRGTKRERWWHSVHRGSRFDMRLDEENRETGGEYLRAVALNYSDRMLAFAEHIETVDREYGQDWADACTLSDWSMRLTSGRAQALNGEIHELMRRYRVESEVAADDGTTDPTARTVIAQVQLFPLGDARP